MWERRKRNALRVNVQARQPAVYVTTRTKYRTVNYLPLTEPHPARFRATQTECLAADRTSAVNEVDHSQIERAASLDNSEQERAAFARRTLGWASSHGGKTVVWSFHTRQSVTHLSGDSVLRGLADGLLRHGGVKVKGVNVVLDTSRMKGVRGIAGAPVGVWWATDDCLFKLEASRPVVVDALLSGTDRAPIWLTAFNVDAGSQVGVAKSASGPPGHDGQLEPTTVPDDLQETITSFSRGMNLVNGVHDSLADRLVHYAREQVRLGATTPEAVAVAALRSGWPTGAISALIEKVDVPR